MTAGKRGVGRGTDPERDTEGDHERVRVLVTSDTHLRDGAHLPTALLQLARRADHIVHAGDLVTRDVAATLAAFAPLSAVHGNVDDAPTCAALPERLEVELGGVRIGVVHDGGSATGRHPRLADWFPSCAIRVYGHSHMPELERAPDGSIVLNPGSPVQRRRAPSHTAAWLEVGDGSVLALDLVDLDVLRSA